MRFLIRKLAEAIARQIERGSLWYAFLGCLAGAVLGFLIALAASGFLPPEWKIILTLLLGLVGGFRGSFIKSGGSIPPSNEHAPETVPVLPPQSRVRITNFNAALGMLAAALIMMLLSVGFGVAILLDPKEAQGDPYGSWRMVGFGFLLGLGSFIAFSQQILWLEIGDVIHLRYPFSQLDIPKHRIRFWGFMLSETEFTQKVPTSPTLFRLEVDHVKEFSVTVSSEKAKEIVIHLRQGAGVAATINNAN